MSAPASLHLEVNEKTRVIYMIRCGADSSGRLREQNRTAFHKADWVKLSTKKWIQKRDHFIRKWHESAHKFNQENGNRLIQTSLHQMH